MRPYTVGSLFAGIGGFDLGFERAGFETVWQVEINDWCRKVLAKNFPKAERYADIRECGAHNLRPVDVVVGGFPCQDISNAGLRAGITGERSGLVVEMVRIIGELRPKYVLMENVAALLGRGMGGVLGYLSEIGYDAEWEIVSAADVGAPHLRRRIWILAYPFRLGCVRSSVTGASAHHEDWESTPYRQGRDAIAMPPQPDGENVAYPLRDGFYPPQPRELRGAYGTQSSGANRIIQAGGRGACQDGGPSGLGPHRGYVAYADGDDVQGQLSSGADAEEWPQLRERPAGSRDAGRGEFWVVEPNVGRVADGIPARVDRLRGLGNAVVPQIPEMYARRIAELLNHNPQPIEV